MIHDDIIEKIEKGMSPAANKWAKFIANVWRQFPLPYDERIDHRTCNKCKTLFPKVPIVDHEEWCPKCDCKWKPYKRPAPEREAYMAVVRQRAEIYCAAAGRGDPSIGMDVTVAVNILLNRDRKTFLRSKTNLGRILDLISKALRRLYEDFF